MAEVGLARDQIRSIVERIERLEEERKAIGDDIRDTKVLRQVVRIRKQDTTQRQEEDAIRDLYLHALGMIPDPRSD